MPPNHADNGAGNDTTGAPTGRRPSPLEGQGTLTRRSSSRTEAQTTYSATRGTKASHKPGKPSSGAKFCEFGANGYAKRERGRRDVRHWNAANLCLNPRQHSKQRVPQGDTIVLFPESSGLGVLVARPTETQEDHGKVLGPLAERLGATDGHHQPRSTLHQRVADLEREH